MSLNITAKADAAASLYPMALERLEERFNKRRNELLDEYESGKCHDWLDCIADPYAWMDRVSRLVIDGKADEARDEVRKAMDDAATHFAEMNL